MSVVLGRTLRIAVITTIVCALLGYPLAYWMRGLSPQRQVLPSRWCAALLDHILVRTYA